MRVAKRAFTIVEIVVIVTVIAILAGVVMVGYGAITRNAAETALKHNLTSASDAIEGYKIVKKSFPDTLADAGVYEPEGTEYNYDHDTVGYCLEGVSGDVTFHISGDSDDVIEGECTGV